MRKMLSIFLLLLITVTVNADIYKWVGRDGNTHFGDRPNNGGEQIKLLPLQSYSPPSAVREEFNLLSTQEDVRYQLKIVAPVPEATIRDNQGQIDITLNVVPNFEAEQKIRLLVDNKPVIETANLTIQITGAERGAHTLQAQLIDSAGKVLTSSETVTVYLHQKTSLKHNKPKPKAN